MAATQKATNQATIRVPLVSTYNTREFDPSASAEDATVSGYVGYGIVGLMIVGYPLTSGKDVRYVNMMPIKITNPLTGKDYFYSQKRPGWSADETLDNTKACTAMTIWRGKGDGTDRVYGLGSSMYLNDSTGGFGTITGNAEFITETEESGTAKLTITSSDSTMWYYPQSGSLTKVTDVDFPSNQTPAKTIVGPAVHMDGYAFVLTYDGYLYNSDQGNLSSWNALNFIKTNAMPDHGIGLARYKNHIVAFSSNSIEFFDDVGTANESPLKRLDSITLRLGCINSHSYKNVEDSLVWISTATTGGSSIYVLNGYVPEKISTPIIDSQIALSDPDTMNIQTAKIFGRVLIFLNLDVKTYVFSLEDGIWHEWSSGYRYWDRMEGLSTGTGHIFGISLTNNSNVRGKSWYINVDSPSYTDNDSIYTAVITTPKLDFDNNNRKRLHKLTLIGDRYTASNVVNISWSDDDYVNFSDGRDIDMNVRGVLFNCGQFRRRAFKLINNESNALRVEALECFLTQGTT